MIMTKILLPRYPIYIPSKGRADRCLTAQFFVKDKVPFLLVIEPQEHDEYATIFGEKRILVLPFSDPGSVIPARNWIKKYAMAAGHHRHWQFDDNIYRIRRLFRGKRIPCVAGIALRVIEDFVDRYENIAIAGLNYTMFGFGTAMRNPFILNCHVYSCSLILNSIPNQWRGQYNEDTDYCLQVLSNGWCTILVNAFLADKVTTMAMKGGNTDALYQNDGRLKMAHALERVWPGVVEVKRRFGRPQHIVRNSWRKFDTPLIRKPDLEIDEAINEYGMELVQVKSIRSDGIKRVLEERK